MTKVVVTGMGIITAIGENLHENHLRLQLAESGISLATHFKSVYAAKLPFGEVKCGNEELIKFLDLKDSKGFTRTDLLAFKAFGEAIADANLSADEVSSRDTAFISASTVGGMCLTDQLYQDANLHINGSEYIDAYSAAAHTLKLTQSYKISGFTDTINTACSSSANAILLGARLIKSGRVKRAIVGGVDSLAKYTVNGFNALKILSEFPCKPFDENRDGLNLGEGAAYLVLESEEVAVSKKSYAEIAGYGNANDAHHPSAMSDDAVGAVLSMQLALRSAGIQSSQIDYINAHGTGTGNNDKVESLALIKVFGSVPHYSSTKSFTGHTLGAAGAVEAVFSILAICNSEIYPSLRVDTTVEPYQISPALEFMKEIPVNYVISNSFGFGGNCTSLVFGKSTF